MISQKAQERFETLYQRLIVNCVHNQIRTGINNSAAFTEADLGFLISVASRLALESEETGQSGAAKRMKAYEIATRVLDFATNGNSGLHSAARLILARLGNFPACDLLNSMQPATNESFLPPYLELEAAARQVENTVQISKNLPVSLTDFQVRMLRSLELHPAVSISAPTSAGKSFVLSLDIVRRFERRKPLTAVYLVPTRALIRQVMYDTIEKLNAHGLPDVPVLCVPESLSPTDAPKGIVYVLTQERLYTLLYAPSTDSKQIVDVLIVDEAQEISEGGRGLVLETVIDRTLRRNPNAAVFFSSPLRSNPGYLLTLFNRENGEFFVERTSPVSQTLIFVRPVKGKPETAQVQVNVDDVPVTVEEIQLSFKFRGQYLAKLAIEFTREAECSILYANGASSAESLAEEIARNLPKLTVLDDDVIDLIEFVREHIHRKYSLADCLERGVAFHYGQMPQIVRAGIEDLLKKRALRFVCCTSTLLQGVNLPAKNIFIENPKKGRGKPMQPGDFWNLAGRAGRLTKEFHGNVWCIHGKVWENDPLVGEKLEEVTSAFRTTITEEPSRILDVIKDPARPSEDEDYIYEQVFGRMFVDYHLENRPLDELMKGMAEDKKPLLGEISQLCATVAKDITLAHDVLARNATISPLKLEELALFFRQQVRLNDWIPVIPMSKQGYATMRQIFKKLDDIFFRTGKDSYIYHCWLASQWMSGQSLKELIANKLKRDEVPNNPAAISKTIRALFDDLERVLRFKYVKYLRAYNDVLRAVLVQRGDTELSNSIIPLHLLIEYGAYDPTLIHLMALGMSRTSAILLKSLLRLSSNMSRPECQQRINKMDIREINLPTICKEEITRIKRI